MVQNTVNNGILNSQTQEGIPVTYMMLTDRPYDLCIKLNSCSTCNAKKLCYPNMFADED